MPAIQAMRSDAMALRSKEDVQEKIPSFYNQVNQALGQSIVSGQDAAEQLLEQRFQAANQLAAQIRQKVDGQGAIAELTAGAGLKMISSALSITLAVMSKTTTMDLLEMASALINFSFEITTLKLQWEAAAATYAQWTVQAGFTGHGDFFGAAPPTGTGSTPTQVPPGTPVTNSFTAQQFLALGGGPIGTPTRTGDGAQARANLNGRSYSTASPQPTGLTPYESRRLANPNPVLQDPNQPYDATNNPYVPATYHPVNNPYVYEPVYVTMDAQTGGADNNSPNNPAGTSDQIAQLYVDASGNLFLSFNVSWTATGGTGSSSAPPTVSGGISTVQYDVNPTATNPAERYVDVSFSNPSQSAPGTGDPRFTFSAPPPAGVMNRAMGGRGALRYRDALTPRYTDRNNYRASATDYRDYDSWYAWGSVGSISRVGQY